MTRECIDNDSGLTLGHKNEINREAGTIKGRKDSSAGELKNTASDH